MYENSKIIAMARSLGKILQTDGMIAVETEDRRACIRDGKIRSAQRQTVKTGDGNFLVLMGIDIRKTGGDHVLVRKTHIGGKHLVGHFIVSMVGKAEEIEDHNGEQEQRSSDQYQ